MCVQFDYSHFICLLTLRKTLNGGNLTDCDATMNENSGCDVTEWSVASYGPLFEASVGGVIAMKWDKNGISVCERHFMYISSMQLLTKVT
jgi:hypothetical protein